MKRRPDVERDRPRWPDAFSGMYARIRYQSYLHALAVIALAVQGVLLYRMGAQAAAHVYEVRPNGEAVYVGDRQSNRHPRPMEAEYVARQFVELMYGWNSSTIHDDLTAAINLCHSDTLGAQLRKEVASATYIDLIRRRQIRSEMSLEDVRIVETKHRYYRVEVRGRVDLFPLTTYDGRPVESKPIAVTLVLSVVPRTPARLNGLEIVRFERSHAEPQ